MGLAAAKSGCDPEIFAGAVPEECIVVLDFGSQYTQLIGRRIREQGVYSHVLPWKTSADKVASLHPAGIVLSGGPETVAAESAPTLSEGLIELGVPILGICYGMQLLAEHFGGRVEPSQQREFGYAEVKRLKPSQLLDGLSDESPGDGIQVWASHGDQVTQLPEGFRCIASSTNAPIAALQAEDAPIYGLQFHPEVTHTPCGGKIFSRFLHDICGCGQQWNLESSLQGRIESVLQTVGDQQVLLGISGGVDSSVAAALLSRALGDRLICVLVDNGLMRKGEVEQVRNDLQELNIHLRTVDAADTFLRHLRDIEDPERKRRVIGATFIEVFEREAEKCGDIQWLAQGTIYSDVIESARSFSDTAHVIKSHHNVGGLPERMNLKLIEPLQDLFKDEVRALGKTLGLSDELLKRHPFPGPGLGVRMLGVLKKSGLDTLREADAIFMEELKNHGWDDKVSQAFAVLLPVNSVGVVGDQRRYAPVIALRAVETTDFMTAHWARLPWELIDTASRRILNTVPNISRVVYDVSGKPPATIEWE